MREYEQREADAAKARDVRWRGEEKAVLRSFEVVHVRDDLPADILPPSASDTTTLKLDELFKDSTSIIDLLDLDLTLYSPSSAEHPDLLKQLFTSLPPSSAAAMRTTLRQRVLERYAASRGHSVILTGHSATRLAAVALDAISSGRAWALGEVVAPFVEGDGGASAQGPLSCC